MPAYEKDPAPIGAGFGEVVAYSDREFEKLRQVVNALNATVETLVRLAELNGVVLLYQWQDDQDTSTAPPSGYMKGNAINIQNATEFALSNQDIYQRGEIGGLLLQVGDFVTIAAADLTAAEVYAVASPPVQLNGGFSVGVTYLDGGGYNPAQDEFVRASWRPANLFGLNFGGRVS